MFPRRKYNSLKNIRTALEQIKWQRHHEGNYSGNDPLLVIQDKLRSVRDGRENILNLEDITTLIRITDRSIKYVGGYSYESNMDGESLRQSAMQPLFDLKTELTEMKGKLRNV